MDLGDNSFNRRESIVIKISYGSTLVEAHTGVGEQTFVHHNRDQWCFNNASPNSAMLSSGKLVRDHYVLSSTSTSTTSVWPVHSVFIYLVTTVTK